MPDSGEIIREQERELSLYKLYARMHGHREAREVNTWIEEQLKRLAELEAEEQA